MTLEERVRELAPSHALGCSLLRVSLKHRLGVLFPHELLDQQGALVDNAFLLCSHLLLVSEELLCHLVLVV